ncbi:hypothetical protein [Bacillus paranthracis]|uniref:Uncharacterized protein n=1 Tax=Bacillus paranthracis TaxID=2026186 RepID=A0AAJ1KCI1_9BACI|nr:hypothetical protein [Bacillus paranthracis]MDG0949877.1 hypothetical protein [Bacillus paranthracis]MDG0955700.1 hypothetical protein [Bacillus paranthracis]
MAVLQMQDFLKEYIQWWIEKYNLTLIHSSYILPGRENHSLSSSIETVVYEEPIIQNVSELQVCSQEYINKESKPKEIQMELIEDLFNVIVWEVTEGINQMGKDTLIIDTPADSIVGEDSNVILTTGEKRMQEYSRKWRIIRPFTLKPKTKTIATLVVKQKNIKRSFIVSRKLTGYIQIVTSNTQNEKQVSYHHIKAIAQKIFNPYVQIKESGVFMLNKGMYQTNLISDYYIHIEERLLQSLDIVREYKISLQINDQGHIII